MQGTLIGLARVDISPPIGATLVGYQSRVSTSIDVPLFAEAMVCRDDDQAWALISCDVLGLAASLVADIRARIAARCPLRESAIMISVSHTHSGPNTIASQQSQLPEIDQQYRLWFIDRIVEVVLEAYDRAQESSLSYVHADIPRFAHNRRVQNEENEWTNEWTDPQGQHPGFVDTELCLIAIRGPDQSLRGLLINYACHPVTLGPQSLAISPDYVGYLKQALMEHFNISYVGFCLAGAANLNPLDCINEETTATQKMGRELADQIIPLLDQTNLSQTHTLASERMAWTFERTRQRPKAKSMKDEDQFINSEFQLLACGDIAIIALPGELFCEFNKRLRAVSPYACTIVASISNDYIGYLPTDQAISEGAYEVNMAPADNLEAMIMESCSTLLNA